jgi:hypothetical protein
MRSAALTAVVRADAECLCVEDFTTGRCLRVVADIQGDELLDVGAIRRVASVHAACRLLKVGEGDVGDHGGLVNRRPDHVPDGDELRGVVCDAGGVEL